ncbi:hypothetical protein WKH44_17580 [Pantoea agglomerans]|uniref:hypothetical protein n=1 Tax=Enterobacter agglomerans TaxID=549 RepID=UPI003C7C2D60
MKTKDYESYAFTRIKNFIAQEVYIMAVRKKYPSVYDYICKINFKLREGFSYIKTEYDDIISNEFEYFIETMLNSVVHCASYNVKKDVVINWLYNIYPADEYEHDDEIINVLENLKKRMLISLEDISLVTTCHSFNFSHEFPPFVFCLCNNHVFALLYYYGKEYLPKIKQENKKVTITSVREPFQIRRSYGRDLYRTRKEKVEIYVPKESLRKKMKASDGVLDFSNTQDDLIQEFFYTSLLPDSETVSLTKELRIGIDTTISLDNLVVDKLLEMIRYELSTVQKDNKNARYVLAKNLNELEEASKIPEISKANIIVFERLHMSHLPEIKGEIIVKNYLCGLIILNRYLFENEGGLSLDNLYSNLSEELTVNYKIDKSNFSSVTIRRGYEAINKMLKNKIELI